MISCAARTTIVVEEEEETLCFFTALFAKEMDARAVMDWQACILSGDVHFFCVGRQKQERGTRVGRNEKRTVLKFYETTPRGRFVVLRFGLRDYRFRCVCVCWSSSSRERNESKKAALLESSLSLSLSL